MRHVAKWVWVLGGLVASAAFAATSENPSSAQSTVDEVVVSGGTSGYVGPAPRPYGQFCHCPPQPNDPQFCPPCTDGGTDAGEVDAGTDAGVEADAGQVETDGGTGGGTDAGQQTDQLSYVGGGCSCGVASGSQAVFTVGLLTAIALLARRRASGSARK